MALKFNSFMSGPNGLISVFTSRGPQNSSGTGTIRIYPSTVAFPSECPPDALPTAGHIISLSMSSSWWTVNSTTGRLGLNNVPLTVTPTASGTLSWWLFYNPNAGGAAFMSDSIGVTGDNKVLTVSTLSATSNVAMQITGFSLTLGIV